MKKTLLFTALSLTVLTFAFGKTTRNSAEESAQNYKYSVSTTYLSLVNFEEEKTNTHHYELHLGYKLSSKDKIGIKLATWKMFAPMGMPMEEQFKFDESNFYPGRLRETGIGVTYQRMLWKGLFVSTEILPQLKTYVDKDNKKLSNGFKLYTSYHLGYHVSLFKERVYLEPQIHCQYWPVDSNAPKAFKDKDDEWNNYFLFEPNLYLGLNFNY
ncbi:MAG: hypothetical protein CVU50_05595 [Candidatus Cloacimonetes bacterium HGW-Cloacimonetes-3]|jgi:hypothetical protein|nr:MAG: hypothetical protein CVU50_05595 [Candidatus Cloacimonetes bacterium HGW-Cloacimonetes-3]